MSSEFKCLRDPAELAARIEEWLASQVGRTGAKGVVVGLSGGIDSAVASAIAERIFHRDMLTVIMPCHSDPRDAEDALLVANHFDIPCKTVDLSETFDVLTASMRKTELVLSDMALANIKARLRMVTLYGVAQSRSYLVCGTSNRSEWEIGYFTKYGDSASDLLPLIGLLKCEVRAVARYLGVPGSIVAKPPTAGLWTGQTDEKEMGFGYDELDRYLATGQADPGTARKIEDMRQKSEHKRHPAPACLLP